MKYFQPILMAIFGVAVLIALFLFTKTKSSTPNADPNALTGSIVVWGTFPSRNWSELIAETAKVGKDLRITYVEKNPETYSEELLEAIASGKSPDLFLAPHTMLTQYKDKILHVPIGDQGIPVTTFEQTYISGAAIFIDNEGLAALPFSVDPLMMFYNKDIVEGNGYLSVPEVWDQSFLSFVNELTIRDNDNAILQSGVAFGEFDNIRNAKSILSTLMLQAGNPIVAYSEGRPQSFINESSSIDKQPIARALRFFLGFSNPTQGAYTWNGAMPEDEAVFVSSDLVLYFGHASEYQTLQKRNPNMNIGVAEVPQLGSDITDRRVVFGTFYGLAVPKASQNQALASRVRTLIASGPTSKDLITSTGTIPVRRSDLSQADSLMRTTMYKSAIISRAWVDPDANKTKEAFRAFVNNALTGQRSVDSAVSALNQSVSRLLN